MRFIRSREQSRKPFIPKVAPVRIARLDQRKLPFTLPFFDAFFASNGQDNFVVPFDIYKTRLVKVQDVSGAFSFAMLMDTPHYISGDANIHPAAIAVRHDINLTAFFHAGNITKCCEEEKPNPGSSPG
jgi:hypothetical protein